MKIKKTIILFLFLMLSVSSVRSEVITYTFDADLEGWYNVLTSTTGSKAFSFQQSTSLLRLESPGISVDPVTRDAEQSSGLLIRSPSFQILDTSSFTISFELGSGSPTTAGSPTTDSDSILSQASTADGYAGLLLRNESTGQYLLASTMTNTSAREQTIVWSSAQLQSIVNTSDIYSLDLVDMDHGPWGWISFDNVSITSATAIPEPSTYTAILASLSLFVFYFKRRTI